MPNDSRDEAAAREAYRRVFASGKWNDCLFDDALTEAARDALTMGKASFPKNIQVGDVILVRARVVLTHIHRPENPALLLDFGRGEEAEVPLTAAFGIVTNINGEKP